MRVKRFRKIAVRFIIGLAQEFTPRGDWPYAQDWIVDTVSLDTGNRCLWLAGKLGENREPFFWRMDCGIKLSWRYDFTRARYFIGRHER